MSVLFVLQLLVTVFLIILIPIYWRKYGLANFLWLSDVGLFLTFLGLWFKSPLLISMAVIGVMPLEILWFIDLLLHLFKLPHLRITDYMFDPKYSLFLRSLSFFHVFVPIIWLGLLQWWGYDIHAFVYQSVLMAIVFLLAYFLSDPKENVNWVYTSQALGWKIPSLAWVIFTIILATFGILFPMHLLMMSIYK